MIGERARQGPVIEGRDLALVALVLAGSALLRYQAIEPVAIRNVCGAMPWEGWCALRSLVMLPFRHREIGWIGLAVAATGYAASRLAGPSSDSGRLATLLSRLGLALGAAGLILYSFDPAAVALILGAFTLARLRAETQATPTVTST